VNDGTWEKVPTPDRTRPSMPVELSVNAGSPVPSDEGFGEFPPSDRALTYNGGLWHYGKRLAITEKDWILHPVALLTCVGGQAFFHVMAIRVYPLCAVNLRLCMLMLLDRWLRRFTCTQG